jgi:hypothetical protein
MLEIFRRIARQEEDVNARLRVEVMNDYEVVIMGYDSIRAERDW